jgi:lipopolysaccharide export LptBFGC system permease protein LptF
MFLESHWIRSGEAVMHFESYDRIRGVLREPTLYIFDGPNALKSVSRSSRAYFDPRSESWVLQDAIETSFHSGAAGELLLRDRAPRSKNEPLATQWQDKGQSHRGPHLATRFIRVLDSRLTAEPPRILSANVGSTDLGFLELLKLMRESEQAGISAQKRLIDLYQKVSLPLANVLFIFLAMPFCIRHERQTDTYAGIFVALALALVYWAGNFALRTLAQNGHVPPVLAAFAMSGLLLFFGLWQLRTLTHRI